MKDQQLSFTIDDKEYVACWADIRSLYMEDRNTSIRLTKLTYNSIFPKPLQRQSVPLVCQVSHDKTVAALTTLKTKLNINEGTIELVRLVTNWFKMMNIKDSVSEMNIDLLGH